ncbi:hypothetical protein DASC09_056770 [Saccharomycopsis crataegensis]|uniref:GH16 domain-containing protein n=1 Tax=Saccharomycopsis crataegensis TaxID=43959 RepID=A0AAV5QW49_9ASCO|nr:hypothetical protein DASC09_056770 [Saccharomycopsis crataegensis]
MVKYNTLLCSLLLLPFTALAGDFASDCDPLQETCPDDVALGGSIELDFTTETPYFSPLAEGSRIKYTDNGLVEWFENHGDAPSLRSNFYIYYGKVEVVCKTASGVGLISNVFLQSDDGDEIDFEWISTYNTQVTTNYFGKGITGNYDRGTVQKVGAALDEAYHTYTIDWQKDKTVWSVDGQVIRTLSISEISNTGDYQYPNSPMRVFLGLWAAGDSSSAGTVEWAGGATSLEGAPFIFNIKSLIVSDYSTGTAYAYGDKTGNNIVVKGDSKGVATTYSSNSTIPGVSTNFTISSAAKPSATSAPAYQIQNLKTTTASISLSSSAGSVDTSALIAAVTGSSTAATFDAAAAAAAGTANPTVEVASSYSASIASEYIPNLNYGAGNSVRYLSTLQKMAIGAVLVTSSFLIL